MSACVLYVVCLGVNMDSLCIMDTYSIDQSVCVWNILRGLCAAYISSISACLCVHYCHGRVSRSSITVCACAWLCVYVSLLSVCQCVFACTHKCLWHWHVVNCMNLVQTQPQTHLPSPLKKFSLTSYLLLSELNLITSIPPYLSTSLQHSLAVWQ